MIFRAIGWLIRRVGPQTLLMLALLLVALGSVAMGLAGEVRGLDSGLLLPMAALGLLVGWSVAKSPVPGWLAALVALVLGAEVVVLRVGRLVGAIMTLLKMPVELVWGVWRWTLVGPPDARSALISLGELWTGVGTLLARLRDWSLALMGGAPIFDPVAVALVWGLLLWVVSAWAGWLVRRRDQPLPGLLPASALLSVSLFYARGNPGFLLATLGAGLLLMVVLGQHRRQERWEATGIDFPLDLGLEVTLGGGALVLALVSLAMLSPSISVQQVAGWTERLMGAQASGAQPVASSLGLDQGTSRSDHVFDRDRVRAPGLPRRHLLGSGPELSERVVMVIYPESDAYPERQERTEDKLAPGLPTVVMPRHYWRSLTYNRYTGRGWITAETELIDYQAGDLAIFRDRFESPGLERQNVLPVPAARRVVRMEVRATSDLSGLLHVTGDLAAVDQDYRIAWRSPNDAFGATLLSAARQARMDGEPVEDNLTVYRVDSLVPVVGEAQLRAAGSDYPDWVEYRYLSLPDEIPERVWSLARDLTATAPNPYDRARAIETYLRTFPYSLELPSPPINKDVVDYFLFDLQQGYCDYYATAMVVLARAAGLPTRLAVGYFSGTYDETNNRYIVTEADAHSWAEIYFPDYGWIVFEPTAGRAPIGRPADVPPSVPSELEKSESAVLVQSREYRPWWLWLPSAVILVVFGVAAWWVIDAWRLRQLPPARAAVVLYLRLYRHGRRLAMPMQPGDTPYEFVTSLERWVKGVPPTKRWAAFFAPAAQEARWLAEYYVRTSYGPHAPCAIARSQAIRVWRRLRRRLWLAWVLRVWTSVSKLTSASPR